MRLTLRHVIPAPLEENLRQQPSDIFANDCRFEHGKNYLVSAPSGKGKSTLMHILYGLRGDYSGTALLDDADVRSLKPDQWSALRSSKLAMVFQDLRLFLSLTAEQNLHVKAQLHPQADYVARAAEWAKRLGVAPYLSQKADTLSYGQRQRVAIVRALCQPFQWLFLDEPFSHLDAANARLAAALIAEVCAEQNASVIMVSLGDDYGMAFDQHLIL